MKPSAKSATISIFVVLIFLFSADSVFPGWFKHYGGTNHDYGRSIQQTSDGGYIFAGYTYSYSHGSDDFAIYKLNSIGNNIWFKHYGGTNSDRGSSIQQTSDGGFVVAGYTYSYSYGQYDFAIYQLNSSGNRIWFKHYGGSNYDYANSIQQTSDGGFVVAGHTYSYSYGDNDFAIYKLDSGGNKVWFKHYGGSNKDEAYSSQQTSDGGYIVAGSTNSYTYGNSDFAIYKLNSSGNKVWFKHYGGSHWDVAYSIQQTSDGGYIVAGYTKSYTYGEEDFAIYKLNSSGNKIWFKHYGGTSDEGGYSVQQTSDGGYIVAGYTRSYTYGNDDLAIYRLDSSGNKVWFKHYGGLNVDTAYSIQQTSVGDYVVAGHTSSYSNGGYDFAVYKLDSAGNK